MCIRDSTYCEEWSEFDLGIPEILSNTKLIGNGIDIEIDGLQIELRPNTLKSINAFNMKNLTTTTLITKIANTDGDRKKELTDQIKNKELGVLSRAGFSYNIVKQVLFESDIEELEELYDQR